MRKFVERKFSTGSPAARAFIGLRNELLQLALWSRVIEHELALARGLAPSVARKPTRKAVAMN